MPDRPLDRHPHRDPRSLAYPVRAVLRPGYRSYSWRHVQLDQRAVPGCTAWGTTMEAAARPVPVFGDPVTAPPDPEAVNAMAARRYARIQEIDRAEGRHYAEGATTIAALKAGVEVGWWTEYRWALGPGPEVAADDVLRMVGTKGPGVLGVWWRSEMNRADADGFLRYAGDYQGGHLLVVTRYSAARDAVWTPNSWGGAGQGWIARSDLVPMLAEDGEAAVVLGRGRGVPV